MPLTYGVTDSAGLTPGRGWLRMDTTQNVSLADSAYYQLGYSDFTFFARAIILALGTGSGSRIATFLTKGIGGTSDFYYQLGTVGGSDRRIAFRFGEGTGTTNLRAFGISTDIETMRGQEINLAFIRRNQDGTLAAALNAANYYISINGATPVQCTELLNSGTITADPFTNSHSATFRSASALDFRGYYDDNAIYNYAMTDAELATINTTKVFPPAGNFGRYEFRSLTGTQELDTSAVANHGTLNNYVAADLGVPTATDVRARVSEVVCTTTANFTKTVTFDYNATLYKVARYNSGNGVATVLHKRAGVTLATINLTFPSGVETVSVSIQAGDTFEFTATGSTSTYWAIELFMQ